MLQEIKTICLSLLFKIGTINCYLLKSDAGYLLIDTGMRNQRAVLEKELASANCRPGDLKLILLTHGDFDHIGNAAFLRAKFGAKIAMHADDAGMATNGDMFYNRRNGNRLFRSIAPLVFGLAKADRFQLDWYVVDGTDLSEYGFDARVLSIPGHSKGSIGTLTANGELFCGDLFENSVQPRLNAIMDDVATANISVEKLLSLNVKTVYPGHGKPFSMEQIRENREKH